MKKAPALINTAESEHSSTTHPKNKQERKKTSTQRRVQGGLFLLLFFLMETDGFAYRARARVWVCVACPY